MEQPENSSSEGEGKAVETSTTATTPQTVAPPTKHAVPTRALPPTPTQHPSPTPTATTAPTSSTDNAATQSPAVLSPRSTQPPPPPSRDTKPTPTFSEASFSSLSASSSSLPAYATTSHPEHVVSAPTTTITATLPRPNVQQIQEQIQPVAGGSGQGAGSKVASLITKTNMSPEEELQRLKEVHETMVKKLQQWQSDLLKRPAVTPVPMSEARAKVEEILKEVYSKPGHPSSIVSSASTPAITVGAAVTGTVAALVASTGAGNRGSTRGPSATISSLNSSSNSNPNPPKVSTLVRSLSQSYGKNNTSSNQLQPPPQADMSVSSDATPTKLPPAPSSPSPSHSSSTIEALKGTTTSQPTTPQPDRKKTPEQQVEALTAEFLQTERTYVNGLRVLVEVYLKGVRADELMSVKDIQTVFSNVDVIFELNQKLLSDLEKTHEAGGGSILKNLCDNLGTFIPFLKMYTQYINNYDNAHKRVKKLSNSAAFKTFLQQCKSRPECNSLGLHDHLIMPVQRLPRYELLLRDILRYTPDDSAEHSKIKNLLGTIQNVNKYVNESKRSQETRQKLYKLKDACKPKGVDIFDRPHRELIKELTLSSHEVQPGEEGRFINHTDSIKFKEHHFFLFDDMMVEVQKLKSDKFKFIRHYNLLHYEVKLSLLEDWLKSKEDSKLNKPAATGAEQHHHHHRPSSAGLHHQLQTKGGGGMSRTSSEIKLGAPSVEDGEDGTESEGSGIHIQRHQQPPLEGGGSDSPLVGKQEQWRRSISGLHNGGGTAAAAASEERAATTEAEEAPDPTSPASSTSTDQQQPHVGALPPGELEMQMQMLMAATQMQMAGSSTSFVLVNRLLDKRVVIRTSSIEAKKEVIKLIEDARERAKALQSEPAKAAEGLPSGSAISNIAGTGLGTLLDGGGEGESSEEEGEGGEEHAATNSGSVVVEEQEQQHQKKKGASMPKRIKSMKLKKEKKKDRRGSLAPSSGSEGNSGIGAGGSTPEQPNPLASSASGLPSSGNSTGGTIRGRIVSAFNKKGSADKGVAGGGTEEDEKKGSKKKKLFGFS
ncbi:Rho guanine nucleotide exchange factor (GEF) 17 [Balamuthia mandrillaris]